MRKWILAAENICPSLSSISFSGLSDTMVGAEMISPLFPFPFYGHELTEFYITTHGFLSLSPRLHDYIYKTQYIAPLRIKLDPSRSNSSTISLLSLPDRLTVEWSNVSVMANAEHPSGGSFTFQVTHISQLHI